MPISPENQKLYPANWKSEIRPRILRRSCIRRGIPCCEDCGVPNYAIGYRDGTGRWFPCPCHEEGNSEVIDGVLCKVIKIVLTIAHLDHDPTNCDDDNLRAWCQRCHLRYDVEHHRQSRRLKRAIGDLFAAT